MYSYWNIFFLIWNCFVIGRLRSLGCIIYCLLPWYLSLFFLGLCAIYLSWSFLYQYKKKLIHLESKCCSIGIRWLQSLSVDLIWKLFLALLGAQDDGKVEHEVTEQEMQKAARGWPRGRAWELQHTGVVTANVLGSKSASEWLLCIFCCLLCSLRWEW